MVLKSHYEIHRCILSFCFLFMICWDKVTWATPAEMCEDESMTNLEYCPIRPGINANFLDLHKHAYLVCEDDILPLCSEKIVLNDKKQSVVLSPSNTTANTTTEIEMAVSEIENPTMTTTTTEKPAQNTTSKEKCPSCEEICDEHNHGSRCDFSEFIQKSRSTFDGVLKVREGVTATAEARESDVNKTSREFSTTNYKEETTRSSTQPRGHRLEVTTSPIHDLQKNRYRGQDQDAYPKVYFDVFFPRLKEERQQHKTATAKSNNIETILDQFNYKGDRRHRRFRRLRRENGDDRRNA